MTLKSSIYLEPEDEGDFVLSETRAPRSIRRTFDDSRSAIRLYVPEDAEEKDRALNIEIARTSVMRVLEGTSPWPKADLRIAKRFAALAHIYPDHCNIWQEVTATTLDNGTRVNILSKEDLKKINAILKGPALPEV